AAVTVGETTHYSNVSKYSILRYAYTVQNDPDAEPTLLTMLTDMLDYGTSAQKHFDYKADRPANGDWYDIRVEGGTLADGFTYGLYMEGDQITLTADSAPAGKVLCWVNSAGVEQTLPITAPAQNETYTAVYKDEVTYSQGLEIEEDERAGAGYVVSIGNCTDTKIVIPPTTENGYPVTEIDRYAFQNDTTITSVSFPNTINTIGRYAFDGCTALTDVYYDGTEEEWAQNVDIESGNEAIENATKHFNAPPAESFIVTFVDYDGTVLKTESVESGKSATAPADPTREGFTFAGWDKAFDNVTADLTVTAQYTYHSTEPTVIVSSATASVGESVTVVVQILNNPGVAGAKFKLQYNDELTLTAAAAGKAFSDLDYTAPAALVNGCPFNWDSLDAESNVDGTFLTLTFTVGDGASVGDVLAVSASYVEGDVYNVELESVSLDIVNGSITVQ
ncbi:MAG: leucine-rich repeat protein, partial [Clostridia bacterium]|nr:leucine-rich repeat protein [Clostridia bacterium]